MIDDSCQVLVSSDDPPKVLKSEDDKILAECETCCPTPGDIKITVDSDWDLTATDTRADCELHYHRTGSASSGEICVNPVDWAVDFTDFHATECPTSSGTCGRTGGAPFFDFLFQNNIQWEIGYLLFFGGLFSNTAWSIICRIQDSGICGVSGGGDCGSSETGITHADAIPDPTHPEGSYTLTASHSETDYSWSVTINYTIALIC